MWTSDNGRRTSEEEWAVVDEKLNETWKSEQILGYLKANNQLGVSHGCIYQRIYGDKRADGTLHRALLCQKVRRKHHTGRERHGTIPNKVSIDQRSEVAN